MFREDVGARHVRAVGGLEDGRREERGDARHEVLRDVRFGWGETVLVGVRRRGVNILIWIDDGVGNHVSVVQRFLERFLELATNIYE